MFDTLAELKEKAAQLPDAERAALALSLIESLEYAKLVRIQTNLRNSP